MLPRPSKHSRTNSVQSYSGSASNGSLFPQFLSASNRHRSSKSQSSLLRISRTNTNNTTVGSVPSGAYIGSTAAYGSTEQMSSAGGDNGGDDQLIRLTDNVPTARPSVHYADKLWTQIDVLDDVKNMSNQVKLRESFFNDDFNEELNRLKASQNKLLAVLAAQHHKLMEEEQNRQAARATKRAHRAQNSSIDDATVDLPRVNEREALVSLVGPRTELFVQTALAGPESVTASTLPPQDVSINSFFGEGDILLKDNILHNSQDMQELDKYIEETRQNLDEVGIAIKNFDVTTRELW